MKRKSLFLFLLLALSAPWAARAQKTLPYEYGFENNDLAGEGWTLQQCSTNTGINANAKQTGSYGFGFYYNSNPPQYLISPELTGCPYGVEMDFYYKASFYQQGETFQLGYSTSSTNVEDFVFGETIEPSTTNWTLLSESFPAGTKYVAVKYTANDQYYLYLDGFSFTALPSCPTPKDLTATLTEGNGTIATLSWTEKGSATNWVLHCGTDANFNSGFYTEYAVSETPTEQLTGLAPETMYYARVKSDCGGGDQSGWSEVCSFKPSNAISMIVNDGTASNYNVPLCQPYGDGSQFIIPASGLSAMAYGQITKLSFYAASTSAFPWTTASYDVYLMETQDSYYSGNVKYPYASMSKVYTGTLSVSDGLMTIDFDTPYYYEGDNLVVSIEDDNSSSTYGNFYWYGVTTTNNQALSGMAGNTLVKFLPKMKIAYLEGVAPTHPRPKYFETTNITSTSATFTWTNGGTETAWQIAYTDDADTTPDDIPAANILDVTTKPYTLAGLDNGTEYYAYIRAVAGNEHSDWSKVCAFMPSCNSPYNFRPNYVTINSARLTWTNGGTEEEWQIVYAAEDINFDPDLAGPIDVTTKPYTLTGLTTDVTYYARIRAKCDVGDYSDWSEPCQIIPTCIETGNLSATVLGPTSAKLNWTPGGNQSGWQIAYSDNAETLPDDATIVDVSAYPPYTLTGLTPDVPYYAYVRSDCGTEHYSDWSSVCSFTPTYILTVNDGTYTNTQVPIYGSVVNNTTQSQFIIPSEALTGLAYADITKLTFYTSSYSSNVNWGTANFNVSMKIVDETTFSSATYDWSDTTRVYSGTLSVSGNLMVIVLDKSFHYEEGNLLIGFNQTATGTSKYSYWYGVSTTSYTALGGYGTYNNMLKFLPKLTFTYTPGTAPTCAKPSGLSASVSSNSTTLTWTAGDEETQWNVQYKAAFTDEWSSIINVENTPTCTLNGLTPGTSYQVRVQADCGGGDVSSWASTSFVTLCGIYNLPFEHDFDHDTPGATADLPLCWTRINDSESSAYQNYPRILADETGQMHSYSSANYMLFYSLGNYSALNQIAVLPEMNAEVSTLVLSFYARLETGNTNQKLAVGVMTDPEDASTFVKYQDVTIASSTYAQYTVDFEDYSGSGRYIAIKCERGASTRYFVDDVNVVVNQTCREPEDLLVADITVNSAVLSWTPGSDVTNWQVQYKKTSDADWSEPIAVNGTPSYTFSNLDATTTYQARVRTDCGNDNYSDWVDAENFTTDCGFVTLPYSHDFDDDATGHVAPTCWHFSDGTYPYIYESSSAHSGNHYLQIKKNTDYAATLVLPAIDTDENPISTLKLTFWAKSSQSTYYYEYLYAGVMTDPDDMSTFHSVQGATTNLSTTTYKQFEFYFDNWTGEGNYIALRYGGSTTYYIDDIEISVAPTCRQPLDLSTQYTNAHEAEIRWKTRDLRQCNYQVSYSTDATFNPEDGTIVDVEFENTLVNAGTDYRDYYMTCLNANTTYYYYVRANCGNGDFSEWSDDYASLTTGEPCPAPYGFNANTVKNTYAELRWYGDIESEWQFQYKKTTDEEWITPTEMEFLNGEGNEIIFRLSGLESGTEYECRVREHCGMYSCPVVDDGYSDWATESFTTGTGCADPQPWMCLTQMGTSATLEWYQTGEERQWQIRYRLDEEWPYPEENIVLTDEMDEARKQRWTIEGLQPSSTYYWQVRAYCDSENQSDWSEESYFYTGGTKVTVDKAHPFYEDFEGGEMPDGFTRCNQYNYDLNYFMPWSYTLAEGPSWDERPDNHGIYNNSSDFHGSTSVILPEMHIDENAVSTMFSFWSYCDYGPSAISGQNISYGSMQIMASTNHGETYDYLWWSFGPHRYWRQHFVDLDDYIGQDVVLRIDYWYANNNPNFDWYIDDVKVQVFDNSFGSGPDVTSGAWDDPTMWGNGTPDGDDDVIINANVTIPDGVVAQANNIVINTDTISTGNRAQKFGKLTIANGGQLITNNAVEVTAQKTVTPWTTNPAGGWYFIASPVDGTLKPKDVDNMLTDETAEPYSYDLYRLNGTQWENYHAHNTNEQPFYLQNGNGYLYANANNTTLEFTGDIRLYNQASNTVPVSEGWNLIGNPYTFAAYPNASYYVLDDERTALNPQTKSAGVAVPPCEGIIVKALSDGTVAFSKEAPAGQTGGDNLQITLTQANMRGDKEMDRAIVSFNAGDELPKFYFGESLANITIPQNGEDYSIVSADAQGELPLNFKTQKNGEYTLTVSASLNSKFLILNYLHLIDNLTGNDVDLLETPSYTFDARQTDYASRFKLVFVKSDADMGDNFAFISDGELIVNGEGTLQVFDVLGHQLFAKKLSTLNSHLSIFKSPGVYVLRLINGDNVKNQKIIIK